MADANIWRRRRRGRVMGTALLCGLQCLFSASLLFTGSAAGVAAAAGNFTPGDRVVSGGDALPAYPSLEAARKGEKSETTITAPRPPILRGSWNEDSSVLGQKDGWLQVRTPDSETPVWVAADKMMLTGKFVEDPANAELCMACDKSKPARFVADLDEKHPGAVLRMVVRPSLNGGAADLEVWDAAEKTMLWSTRGPNGASGGIFDCYPQGDNWPKIVGDVNGDGKADILFTSDTPGPAVWPTAINVLSWDGGAFVKRKKNLALYLQSETMPKSGPLVEDPDNSGWTIDVEQKSYLSLVDLQEMRADGSFTATINLNLSRTEEQKAGIAVLRFSKDWKKFIFEGWASDSEP